MLQTIRNNSQGLLAKIFIGFVIVIFAAFGLNSIVVTIFNSTDTVSVNGVDIDEVAIESEAQRITQELLSSLNADIDLSAIDTTQFREQAINNLVEREVLLQSAIESGMTVSPRTLDREIAQTPDFQVDGVFSNERAQAVLASIGYTPSTYRSALIREDLLNQMLTVYSSSSFATPTEVQTMARISEEKRNFRYVRISSAQLAASQNISDEEISAYYDENTDEFMQGERVSLEYVELNKNDLLAEVQVSDEQVRQQYETEIQSLQAQVERRASHILLQASEGQVQDAIARAEQLRERIDNGESFEDLAAEFSDDAGSAQFGGDVGYTSGETFVPEFEEALQNLQLGEVSGPVRTQFGVHLIKLTEMSENDAPSFEESRDRIEQELREQAVDDIYLARAEELDNLSFESIDLQQPAETLGLEIQTTDLFDRAGGVGIASNQSVIDAAFSSDVRDGLNSPLIALDDSRTVVVRQLEYREPELRELAEVRGEIEASLRMQKAQEQARTLGQTFLNNLNNGQNIDNLLSVQGLEWQGGENLTRDNPGLDPTIVQVIFGMPKPADEEPVYTGQQLSGGDYVLVSLEEVIPGTMEDLDEDDQLNLQAYLMQQEATTDFTSLLSGLEARADIDR